MPAKHKKALTSGAVSYLAEKEVLMCYIHVAHPSGGKRRPKLILSIWSNPLVGLKLLQIIKKATHSGSLYIIGGGCSLERTSLRKIP